MTQLKGISIKDVHASLVESAAIAEEIFGDDELERFTEDLRQEERREVTGDWVCTACGAEHRASFYGHMSEWRTTSSGGKEHHCPGNHPQAGHFLAVFQRFCPVCKGSGVGAVVGCTCGGIDVGAGVLHEPTCGSDQCSACGGSGFKREE